MGLLALQVALGVGGRRDMKRYQMSETERDATDLVGRLGYAGRGVTFAVVGWFLVQAGLHHDAGQAHGYGGAFIFLLAQPIGRQLLGATAICFMALGLHSFAYARWA